MTVEVDIACVVAAVESWGAGLANDDVAADATGILNPMTAATSTIDTKKRENVNIGVSLRVGFMPLPVKLLNLWGFLGPTGRTDSATGAGR